MVSIKGYFEYVNENLLTYLLMLCCLLLYAFLILWNKDDYITIIIMTITFMIGYSFAEYQDSSFKKATKIDIDFRKSKK